MKPSVADAFAGTGPGPVAGFETEDLNVTLLSWPEGHEVASHVNEEVDVVTVVLAGEGEAILDGVSHSLRTGTVLVIPKGTPRAIRSLSADFRYVNIHRRRRKLMPQMGGRPPHPGS